jgi:diacylglycerol kinase family enzyme
VTDTVLIANPAASQFTGALHRTIVRVLGEHHTIETVWPQSASQSRMYAANAAQEGARLVVAIGGDGIVHHVAQGLIGSSSTLGIIPAGTTNVLARMLGIPAKPAAAAKMLATASTSTTWPILEVEADLQGGGTTRFWSLFALGIGPDAAVVEKAEQDPHRKYRFGSIHYARTAVATVWKDVRKRRPTALVEVEETSYPGIGALFQFHQSYTYFGRIPMRLGPSFPDPVTVVVIEQLPIRRALSLLRGATGKKGLSSVKGFRGLEGVDSAIVTSTLPLELQSDGEQMGLTTRVRAIYQPDRLTVATPQSPR